MNLKEWAEENNMTLAEAKAATGLTHWKQEVVEEEVNDAVQEQEAGEVSVSEEPEISKEVAEEVREPVVGDKEYTKEMINLSIRCLGAKSPVWNLRHLVGR